jgi:8-oxo-dGTP pyrophosphatase MutT (NUDIX family)
VPEKIITLYCFFDELLKALGHKDDVQAQLATAEVMTIALVAAEFFTGNQQKALDFLSSHGYIAPLSKSRFNRRLHRVPETLWQMALFVLAQMHQKTNPERVHVVDTFPVPVCHNIRIRRCKLYREEAFRGYCASKKQYYFGLKASVIVTEAGEPVELLLVPASTADITALRSMDLHLPQGSTLFGDSGFLDIAFERALREEAGLRLVVPRRSNMKEQLDGCLEYVCGVSRKRVETTFSQLTERLARSVHAVTPRGFELKIMLTVLAFSIVG